MIRKNTNIKLLVTGSIVLDDTCMSICFARPINFDFSAGDWIDLNFPEGNPAGGITYSLSSSPTEDELAITFKVGISPFKKRLQSLVVGDEMVISQYGNDYNFTLKEHRASVLIAGGIGIAPFRSMLREMSDIGSKDDVQLLYLNKTAPFVFADEISQWQTQLPNVSVQYIETNQLSRKKREKLLKDIVNKTADYYYVAGPEGMVESTEHLLIDDLGIDLRRIRIDSFGGY